MNPMFLNYLSGKLLVALAVLSLTSSLQGADRQLYLRWNELSPHVLQRSVSAELAGGETIRAKVLAVPAETLVCEVKKSSVPGTFQGTAEIPREQITGLRVSKRGWKWRVIGSWAGLLGGGLAGVFIGDHVDPHGFLYSDGAIVGARYGLVGGLALGYVAGHIADRHAVAIKIVR